MSSPGNPVRFIRAPWRYGRGGRVLSPATPQARHHFTTLRQVNQLIEAGEGEPDLGFMARLMALCSLPRTNPKQRTQYVRRNGPYTLVMHAGGVHARLPYGNIPRLLLAWVCTEAVRTEVDPVVWTAYGVEEVKVVLGLIRFGRHRIPLSEDVHQTGSSPICTS